MKMKKILTIALLLFLLTLPLTGCAGKTEDTESGSTETEDTASAEYPISDSSIDMDGHLVRINTEGAGNVARADEEHELYFDPEYPSQSSADHLKDGITLKIGAEPDDGWKFVKWTLNGEDYSTDAETTYVVTEDAELIAVFEIEE